MPRYIVMSLMHPSPNRCTPETDEAMIDASLGKPHKAIGLNLYAATALVEARDPEHLFTVTQHVDTDWTVSHPPLKRAGRLRSTSVGDFIIDEESRHVLFCDRFGWSETTPEQSEVLLGLSILF